MDPNNPPAGIPPLLWLLIFLLGGQAAFAALVSSVAARLPGVFGALGRWWHSRERHSAADAVSRAEIDRVVQDYQRLAQAREEDHEHWRADIAELRAEIAELKRYLTESNQRFWDAVGYIRRLIAALRNHVPDDELPDPPERLDEYL